MQVQQNTPEWLALRKNYIGASDAPVIMGLSPWTTPYQLWQDKLGIGAEKEISAQMQRGLDLEQEARDWFYLSTGININPEVVFHQTVNYLMASIDGMSLDKKVIVEIKCPGKADHAIAKKGSPPIKYYPQLQHQIEVCQVDMAYYLSFDGKEFILLEVPRDDSYIKEMLHKEQCFWDCVNSFRPPELSDRDYVNRDDDVWCNLAHEWKSINNQLYELQARENELRESLRTMARGKNCQGAGVKVTNVLRKGHVDYSRIPNLQGVDLEIYRKPPTEFIKITSDLPF